MELQLHALPFARLPDWFGERVEGAALQRWPTKVFSAMSTSISVSDQTVCICRIDHMDAGRVVMFANLTPEPDRPNWAQVN